MKTMRDKEEKLIHRVNFGERLIRGKIDSLCEFWREIDCMNIFFQVFKVVFCLGNF
jgi:hypothetical protein